MAILCFSPNGCPHGFENALGCRECKASFVIGVVAPDIICNACKKNMEKDGFRINKAKPILLSPEEIARAVPCDTKESVASILDEVRKRFLDE